MQIKLSLIYYSNTSVDSLYKSPKVNVALLLYCCKLKFFSVENNLNMVLNCGKQHK